MHRRAVQLLFTWIRCSAAQCKKMPVNRFRDSALVRFHCLKQRAVVCKFTSNLSPAHKWARDWLLSRPDLIDAPADKGLGCCLLSRKLYDQLTMKCILDSFEAINLERATKVFLEASARIKDICLFAVNQSVLKPVQSDYVCCLCAKITAIIYLH